VRAETRRKSFLGAGLLFGLILLLALSIADRAESPRVGDSGGRMPANLDAPCAGDGTAVTLSKAASEVDFSILVPARDAVGDSDMTGIWVCAGGVVQMRFTSGMQISEEPNTIRDPKAAWEGLAKQDPATTSVGTVRGQPASLVDPAKAEEGAVRGGVDVVDRGLHITVTGDGTIPLADMIAVTESLAPVTIE
jgi:hypothetical protein